VFANATFATRAHSPGCARWGLSVEAAGRKQCAQAQRTGRGRPRSEPARHQGQQPLATGAETGRSWGRTWRCASRRSGCTAAAPGTARPLPHTPGSGTRGSAWGAGAWRTAAVLHVAVLRYMASSRCWEASRPCPVSMVIHRGASCQQNKPQQTSELALGLQSTA